MSPLAKRHSNLFDAEGHHHTDGAQGFEKNGHREEKSVFGNDAILAPALVQSGLTSIARTRNVALCDADGTMHRRSDYPARIVSLVPSITELLCDLGLSAQLVGRTGFCVHPREVLKSIPKVGGTKDVDLAKVRALMPTHVVLNIDENEEPTAKALAEFVPHMIITHPLGPLDNIPLYRLIGGIFGQERAAEALCTRFEYALAALAESAHAWPRQRVLYLIWKNPWMTVSSDTYISRTLAIAGFDTVQTVGPTRYPPVELEETLRQGVEMVLLSSEPYRFQNQHLDELRTLPAMHGKTSAMIDGEMTSWYGSRAIAGMIYLLNFRNKLLNKNYRN